ncbi:protein FAM13A-like isoform X2 [Daphnia pulicaria]|uniref:protein FAM13A-like isoform X2 n=1 Tax=Daphnia pulicaria TaxID=35523 RepID=UPI001EEAC479|nr:protein FAM13A-like isoform X2 [Daphnia pulicaria]
MMRRRTSLEPYDIDNVSSQALNESYQDDQETTNNGPTLQPDSKRTSCIPISHHAPVHCSSAGHPWGGGLDDDSTDDRNDYAPWNDRNEEDLVVASTVSVQDESDFDPMASITVQMSIWKELSAGQPSDENQSWTNDATLCWRRYPFAVEDEISSPISYGSPATYPMVPDEEVELVSADTERSEHEERRILERFASFPSGNKSRPVSILLGGGCGGTPKGGRRRNKRKGCDSPRSSAEDKNNTTVKPEATTPDILPAGELPIIDPFAEKCSNSGSQGQFRQQLCFDLMQLQDKEEEEHVNGQDGDGQGNEPVTSHGMRPARGWASLNILPDEDDEDVTVSPRVLSPEMDEPAGSFHVRGFHGRCKEPQEKRTAFIALGNLNNFKSPNRNLAGSDEHPATLRARQLVQQIHSLKQKVKLYEDAFEQRYGYRPSHHQKMDDRNTKRVLTELARTRKELKQLKERYHLVEPVEISETRDPAGTTTTATFFTTKERPSAPPCATTPSVEETVLEVQEHLTSNRQLAGRLEAIDKLTAKQVLDEKLAVQRALLYVESLHGRPASYRHKDLLRPLYDRYRILKRMVVRSGLSRSKEEVCDLAPILEYETLELYETRPGGLGHRHSAPATPSLESMEETDPRTAAASTSRQRHLGMTPMTPITGVELRKENGLASWNSDDPMLLMWKRQKISLNIDENLHALPLNQLMDQLRHVREEKRRLRRTIRDLEADMLRQQCPAPPRYSSSAGNDEDVDGHLEPVYAQYRHARAKLRLLEALVAKHDGSATL